MEEFKGKNYYKILDVGQKASTQKIREAYHKKALKHHPDKNPENKKEATEIFKILGRAYETLSNPTKRAKYDEKSRKKASDILHPHPRPQAYKHEETRESEIKRRDDDLAHFYELFNVVHSFFEELKRNREQKRSLGEQLVIAAKKGRWQKVEILIFKGATLNEQHPKDKLRRTAIHFATIRKDSQALQMLCEAYNKSIINNLIGSSIVTSVDNFGSTALHYCASLYNPDDEQDSYYILDLIDKGARPYHKNNKGNTPLHFAIKHNNEALAMFLSKLNIKKPLTIGRLMSHDIQNDDGDTPLHLALKKGWKNVADSLLKYKAATNIKNNKGFTASKNNYPLYIPQPVRERTL